MLKLGRLIRPGCLVHDDVFAERYIVLGADVLDHSDEIILRLTLLSAHRCGSVREVDVTLPAGHKTKNGCIVNALTNVYGFTALASS